MTYDTRGLADEKIDGGARFRRLVRLERACARYDLLHAGMENGVAEETGEMET